MQEQRPHQAKQRVDPGDSVTFGLYLLDVCVSRLTLNKEVYIDTGGSKLVVKVAFLDFPVTEVKERKRSRHNDLYIYDFDGGQSIHFSIPCDELMKKMKRVPLSIGVFRENDSFPVCDLKTSLNGCACDLGTVWVKNAAPFKFGGPFELTDSGKSFAGQLGLDVTIWNFGQCLAMRYALAPGCFLFKKGPDEPEFKCNFKNSSNRPGGVQHSFGDGTTMITGTPRTTMDPESRGSLMKDIAGISPMADHLGEGSPPPKPPYFPLPGPPQVKRKKGKGKGKKK